jgi:hypothetical protein
MATGLTGFEIMSIITTDDVKLAAQAVADKHTAFEQAKEAFLAADVAVKAAEHRADNAKHDEDPAALVDAVEAADRALRTAKVAAKVAAAQLASAKEVYAKTLHDSLEAEHTAAKAARMDACQRADKARADMEAATQDFHAANMRLDRCYNAGRVRNFDGADLKMVIEHNVTQVLHVPTVSQENDLWGNA